MHHSTGNYGLSAVPSWISINSSTGILSIAQSSVVTDTEFDFYVVSTVSGVSNSVKKLIKLIIMKWKVQNWQKWSSSNSNIWESWGPEYNLVSNFWILKSVPQNTQNFQNSQKEVSNESKILGLIIAIIIGSSFLIVSLISLVNSSSMTSLWAMVNQVQLFFLLLLTRAFIPLDVQNVITGVKFVLNIAPFIYFQNIKIISSIIEEFEFNLSNKTLDLLNIKSDSSLFNISSIIMLAIMIISFHLFIALSKLMLSGDSTWGWNLIKQFVRKCITKIFIILTFGTYIRYIFETNQFILISTIHETYKFNQEDHYIAFKIYNNVLN